MDNHFCLEFAHSPIILLSLFQKESIFCLLSLYLIVKNLRLDIKNSILPFFSKQPGLVFLASLLNIYTFPKTGSFKLNKLNQTPQSPYTIILLLVMSIIVSTGALIKYHLVNNYYFFIVVRYFGLLSAVVEGAGGSGTGDGDGGGGGGGRVAFGGGIGDYIVVILVIITGGSYCFFSG